MAYRNVAEFRETFSDQRVVYKPSVINAALARLFGDLACSFE